MSPDRVLTSIVAVDLLLACPVMSMEQIAGCVGEGDEVVVSKAARAMRVWDIVISSTRGLLPEACATLTILFRTYTLMLSCLQLSLPCFAL